MTVDDLATIALVLLGLLAAGLWTAVGALLRKAPPHTPAPVNFQADEAALAALGDVLAQERALGRDEGRAQALHPSNFGHEHQGPVVVRFRIVPDDPDVCVRCGYHETNGHHPDCTLYRRPEPCCGPCGDVVDEVGPPIPPGGFYTPEEPFPPTSSAFHHPAPGWNPWDPEAAPPIIVEGYRWVYRDEPAATAGLPWVIQPAGDEATVARHAQGAAEAQALVNSYARRYSPA